MVLWRYSYRAMAFSSFVFAPERSKTVLTSESSELASTVLSVATLKPATSARTAPTRPRTNQAARHIKAGRDMVFSFGRRMLAQAAVWIRVPKQPFRTRADFSVVSRWPPPCDRDSSRLRWIAGSSHALFGPEEPQ